MTTYSDQQSDSKQCPFRRSSKGLKLTCLVGAIALIVTLSCLLLALPSGAAEEGQDDAFYMEPTLARELDEFKKEAGPLVPTERSYRPGAVPFATSKSGVNLSGAAWFEGGQLVVDAVITTENQTFIPQNLKLWGPEGHLFDSRLTTAPQGVKSSGPDLLPMALNVGLTFASSAGSHRHTGRHHYQKHRASRESCTDCTKGYSRRTPEHRRPRHEYHEDYGERRGSRFFPNASILLTPSITAQPESQPQAPPPRQHRFPSPPCPGRLKGWSVGTMAPGPGHLVPLVALLDEPPDAFARTAPCQILAVMSFPPGREGAEKNMAEIARSQGLDLLRSFSLPSINKVVALMEASGSGPLDNIINNLKTHSLVEYAQPNNLYMTTIYNDPLAGLQYGPRLIEADRAHQFATGEAVTVAVIDTAIDGEHPDLAGKIVEQVDLIGPDPPGLEGVHGTLISGVISATENNRVGGYGVAPHVKILGLKACKPLPESPVEAACTSESIARALDEAITRKVRLVNMSLGGPPERLIETLVNKAASRNIIILAAAGNGGPKAPPSYPAAYGPVLAVSAVDSEDKHFNQANIGNYVDLTAPGVDILSTIPGNRFNVFSGTSIATAHATAAAALLLQAKPDLSQNEVIEALEKSAVDLGPKGRDPEFGAGRINACRALELVSRKTICLR